MRQIILVQCLENSKSSRNTHWYLSGPLGVLKHGLGPSYFSDIYWSRWLGVGPASAWGKEKVRCRLQPSCEKYCQREFSCCNVDHMTYGKGGVSQAFSDAAQGRWGGRQENTWLGLWIRILSSNPGPATSWVILGRPSRLWISVSPPWNRPMIVRPWLGCWTDEKSTFGVLELYLEHGTGSQACEMVRVCNIQGNQMAPRFFNLAYLQPPLLFFLKATQVQLDLILTGWSFFHPFVRAVDPALVSLLTK